MLIRFYDTVDSTQTQACALVKQGDRRWGAVCADTQTAGRGRQGATWHDTPNQSLLVSLILWDTPLPQPAGALSAFASLATAQALHAHYPNLPAIQLKYPNDLMLLGRKLGGALVEVAEGVAIVGVGVNLAQRIFPPELESLAISLAQATSMPEVISREERAALIARLRDALIELLRLWTIQPDAVHKLWQARDTTVGRAYRVLDLPDRPEATALEVTPDFQLRLRLPSGVVHDTYYVEQSRPTP
ncbi:MAG: biotin--[acetyl-CoA-carboxylase] ligase [Fimbriimonadales bacterium]